MRLDAAKYSVRDVPMHGEAEALIRCLHYSRSCPNTSTYRHGLYAVADGFMAHLADSLLAAAREATPGRLP